MSSLFLQVSKMEWSYAFMGSLSKAFPFLQQSPGVRRQWRGVLSALGSTQELLPPAQPFFAD